MGTINVNWSGHVFKVSFMHGIKKGDRYYSKAHFSNEEKERPSFPKRSRRTFCDIVIPESFRREFENTLPQIISSSVRYHRKDKMVKSNARKFALRKTLDDIVYSIGSSGVYNETWEFGNRKQLIKEMRTTFWIALFG